MARLGIPSFPWRLLVTREQARGSRLIRGVSSKVFRQSPLSTSRSPGTLISPALSPLPSLRSLHVDELLPSTDVRTRGELQGGGIGIPRRDATRPRATVVKYPRGVAIGRAKRYPMSFTVLLLSLFLLPKSLFRHDLKLRGVAPASS